MASIVLIGGVAYFLWSQVGREAKAANDEADRDAVRIADVGITDVDVLERPDEATLEVQKSQRLRARTRRERLQQQGDLQSELAARVAITASRNRIEGRRNALVRRRRRPLRALTTTLAGVRGAVSRAIVNN